MATIGNGKIVSQVYGWRDETSEQYEFSPDKFYKAYDKMMSFLEQDDQYFELDLDFINKIGVMFNAWTEPLEEKLPELKKMLNERLCQFRV